MFDRLLTQPVFRFRPALDASPNGEVFRKECGDNPGVGVL
jgi:hypothetical protein